MPNIEKWININTHIEEIITKVFPNEEKEIKEIDNKLLIVWKKSNEIMIFTIKDNKIKTCCIWEVLETNSELYKLVEKYINKMWYSFNWKYDFINIKTWEKIPTFSEQWIDLYKYYTFFTDSWIYIYSLVKKDKLVIPYMIINKTIRPIDLLLLKINWQISEQDYQKYLPQVKELLKTQLTDEYYKIFLQIPNFFPFSHITQKELDFYAGKIKEYKTNIPWIWKIVLKLDKPIISEEAYQEYSKKLSELEEKYLGETQQDILNLQEEIKFTSMNELIQAIREHKLKEFWQIKEEYWIHKDKEKLKKSILKLIEKYYKPYNKLSDEEKKLVEKLIIWVEVNSK